MDIKEKNELLLTQLVLMFQTAALQHMGKLKNPLSDKIEKDLSQAQISIDMLEMIQTKMKGNLTPDEARLFADVLRDLRLNYVDEITKQKSSGETATSAENPPASPESPESP